MKRRLFSILFVVSLLLLLAVCALWVRSYWQADCLSRFDGGVQRGIMSTRGRVSLWRAENTTVREHPDQVWGMWSGAASDLEEFRILPSSYRQFVGFGYAEWSSQSVSGLHQSEHELVVPLWAVAVASALLPSLSLFGFWRRRADRPGLCPSCGYDLRATPERCPECGRESVAGTNVITPPLFSKWPLNRQ